MAWEDTNCNGVRDGDESSLAGVCVWASLDAGEPTPSPEECADAQFQTDISGLYGGYFFAGASCNDVYIFAQAPEGFCPTTDTVVNDCVGEFGFVPIGLCQCRPVVMPEQSSVQRESRDLVFECPCWLGAFPVAAMAGGVLLVRRHRQGPR
jgi:hypothetical protein